MSPEHARMFNRLIVQDHFRETLDEIKKINVKLSEKPTIGKIDFSAYNFPQSGKIRLLENFGVCELESKKGDTLANKIFWSGYDESKIQYVSLEGLANFTSHVLVLSTKKEYLPVSFLTFYFYSKSKDITDKSKFIKYSEDHVAAANLDYVTDRFYLLNEATIEDTIIFIDGPLIGGNLSSYTIELVESLHKKNVMPIFFVKNSDSNLVTDSIPELNQRFNSDMHWSYRILNIGQRTNFFLYVDEHNPKNAKAFCYLKALDLSPQRIEMHLDTYRLYESQINNLMNSIYYLILVHGDKKNPQIRPIAVAEKFARETLRVFDPYLMIKGSGLVATMNQERFGG